LSRYHRGAKQAVGIWLAVVGQPSVVGVRVRGSLLGIFDVRDGKADARVEERCVDTKVDPIFETAIGRL